MGALDGKHAVVTGASRGIGLAIASALADEGAHLTLVARNGRSLSQAAAAALPGARVEMVDVTDAAAVRKAFAGIGRVDILVNNAGQAASAPFLKTDEALWQRMLDVNLGGVFHCAQAALPGMLEAGWGRIVNVASIAGMKGYPYVSAYCAAKHAVIGMTRSLALEVATRGVTVNAVCPGFTDTDIVRDAVENIVRKTGRSAAQARAELVAGNPQQRLVGPEEVASAVRWLCLPASASINGQSIAIAGGEVM